MFPLHLALHRRNFTRLNYFWQC